MRDLVLAIVFALAMKAPVASSQQPSQKPLPHDGPVVIRQEDDGTRLGGHQQAVYGVAFSFSHIAAAPHGRFLVAASVRHATRVNCVAISSDGQSAVSGGHDGRLRAWSLQLD